MLGPVTTDNAELAATIRALANYGSERKYVFKYAGINSRMSEMDAAVLRIKLKYLDHDNARRQQLADFYYGHISNPLITLPERLPDAHNVYHQFPIFCKERNQLQTFLAQQGVQTLIHYPIPPHKQQCYYEAWGHELSLPVTERIHAEELSIPMSPVVSADEAQQVVDVLNKWQGTSQNAI